MQTSTNASSSPVLLHLSLTHRTKHTDSLQTSSASGDGPAVQYGTSPGNYTRISRATSHTYNHGGWKGLIHDALLTDLQPWTVYYYRVGDLALDKWREDEFHFRSPPLHRPKSLQLEKRNNELVEMERADDEDEVPLPDRPPPVGTVAVFGDAGLSNTANGVLKAIQRDESVDLVAHVGDFGYSLDRGAKPFFIFSHIEPSKCFSYLISIIAYSRYVLDH